MTVPNEPNDTPQQPGPSAAADVPDSAVTSQYQAPAAPPPLPAAPPAPSNQPYPPYVAAPGGYFAPVLRVPWVNPQRRWHLVVSAVIVALIVFGAGIGVGHVITDGTHVVRVRTPFGNGRFAGPGGGFPGRELPGRQRKNTVPGQSGSSSSAPSSSPSSAG